MKRYHLIKKECRQNYTYDYIPNVYRWRDLFTFSWRSLHELKEALCNAAIRRGGSWLRIWFSVGCFRRFLFFLQFHSRVSFLGQINSRFFNFSRLPKEIITSYTLIYKTICSKLRLELKSVCSSIITLSLWALVAVREPLSSTWSILGAITLFFSTKSWDFGWEDRKSVV